MNFTRQSILFISGLDKSVSENQLYQLFNEFPISYIKIAKDHVTKESYGYAFVGLKNHTRAEEALIKLNFTKLGKKTIHISWYNREPNNLRNNPECNIFVKNLPKNLTHKEFHDYFSLYGDVVSAKLAEDEDGEILGYGFVLYDNQESASTAIEQAKELKGKNIYLGQFIKNKPKKTAAFNNVYVRNIPKHWTMEDVTNYFTRYGELGSVILKEPSLENLSRADSDNNIPEYKKNAILSHKFAFVCFKDFNAAKQCVNKASYLKLHCIETNAIIEHIAIMIKHKVEEENVYKCAVYLLENKPNYEEILKDENLLHETFQEFQKELKENDGVYLIKDKEDRLECCQALKKKERIKKLKQLYERIKKQIREKYKFCNLYVKNLPANFDDAALRSIFAKYGEIKSCKTVRKELFLSYMGVKRIVKVFGFVCYFKPESAREAKLALNGKPFSISKNDQVNNIKLFVDYHQNKHERAEYLKLKMLSQKSAFNKQILPPNVFAHQLLRRFPAQQAMGAFGPMNMQVPIMKPQQMDANTRRDYYGEKLYSKICTNPIFANYSEFFSKIVGIFLDLDDNVIERLLSDDLYFDNQVMETIKVKL